jgi:hypothetical protein
VNSYSFGRVVIDGKAYGRDVIIYPDRVDDSWWRKEGHELCVEDIKEAIQVKPDLLIVGTGHSGAMRILPETGVYVKSKGIEFVACRTEEACRIHNEASKSKVVVTLLHLTC